MNLKQLFQKLLIHAQDVAANAQTVAYMNALATRPMTLAIYKRSDQYYANIFATHSPTFQKNDFKQKHAYFTLVGHTPYHGHPHKHYINYLERLEDLVFVIKANGVPEDYLFSKFFNIQFLEMICIGLSSYHQDLSYHGLTSKTPSSVISLMT